MKRAPASLFRLANHRRVDLRKPVEGEHRWSLREQPLGVEVEQTKLLVSKHAGDQRSRNATRLIPCTEEECDQRVEHVVAEILRKAPCAKHETDRQERRERLGPVDPREQLSETLNVRLQALDERRRSAVVPRGVPASERHTEVDRARCDPGLLVKPERVAIRRASALHPVVEPRRRRAIGADHLAGGDAASVRLRLPHLNGEVRTSREGPRGCGARCTASDDEDALGSFMLGHGSFRFRLECLRRAGRCEIDRR